MVFSERNPDPFPTRFRHLPFSNFQQLKRNLSKPFRYCVHHHRHSAFFKGTRREMVRGIGHHLRRCHHDKIAASDNCAMRPSKHATTFRMQPPQQSDLLQRTWCIGILWTHPILSEPIDEE
jgi:hypothetical protein